MEHPIRRLKPLLQGVVFAVLASWAAAQVSQPPTPPPATPPEPPPDSDRADPVTPPPTPPLTPAQGRRRHRPAESPPQPAPIPGPRKPSSPLPGDEDGEGLRGWELWWELNRDRFIAAPARDVSIDVAQIPAERRTRVETDGMRVGSYGRVEPSLRLVLDHESSELVLARALISLAKLGEDPKQPGSRKSYATILPYVYHADATLSEAAITALGILGTEDALFPLAQLIEGGEDVAPTKAGTASARDNPAQPASERQRALAFYAIGLIGRDSDREDVRRFAASRICALYAADTDASTEVRFAALHAISLVPVGVATPRPIEVPSEKQRRSLTWSKRPARTIPRVKSPPIPAASRAAQVEWALSVLDDESEEGWIRAQAVTATARLCAGLSNDSSIRTRAVERLLKLLAPRSPEPAEVEQTAALALGEIGDSDGDELDARIRNCLAETLTTAADQATREFALMSLAQIGSRAGEDFESGDRLQAAADVRRFLLHRAATAKAAELPWNVMAIGVFEHGIQQAGAASARESCAALTDLLIESRSPEQSAACALALGLCGNSDAYDALTAQLKDEDCDVRGYAALSLGMLGAKEAAAAIEGLLSDSRHTPALLASASEALSLLGAPVSRNLLGMMDGGSSLETQLELCTALGRVGDGRCLRALSEVASDKNSLVWVRAAATSALGTMGARRPEPWNADLGHALNFLNVPPTLSSTSLDGLLDIE